MKSAVWIISPSILGFTTSAVFSAGLHWPRPRFVLVHALVVSGLLWLYTRVVRPNWRIQFQRRWRSGVTGGAVLATFLVWSVLRQPGSPGTGAAEMLWSIVWFGIVYGSVDALLLNILPVLEAFRARPAEKLVHGGHRIGARSLALLASLVVTTMYHLGFIEYRGTSLRQPLLGNGIITAGYLVTGSPLTPLIGHVAMHVAAAIHGVETTTQLPPHYTVSHPPAQADKRNGG